jgi:excisionase family DNA binding protein
MIAVDDSALIARIEALEAKVADLSAGLASPQPAAVMTRVEVARLARIGLSSIDEAIRRGDLKAVRKGRRVLIRRADAEAWLGNVGGAK